MPVYVCPECNAKIKRGKPLEQGKKMRCPKCEGAVPASALMAEPKVPAPVARPKNHWDDEDDGPAQYGVTEEVVDPEVEARKQEAFGALKERFEKGKRGPALELVVKPSNYLLLCGVFTCAMALGGAFWSVFPMIFKVERASEAKKSMYIDPNAKQSTRQYIELTAEERTTRFYCLAGFVAFFMWGSVVSAAASKMHEIEMYWLAFTGSVMAMLGPFVPIAIWLTQMATENAELDMGYFGPALIAYVVPGVPVAAWCISTLLKEKVKAGFGEEATV